MVSQRLRKTVARALARRHFFQNSVFNHRAEPTTTYRSANAARIMPHRMVQQNSSAGITWKGMLCGGPTGV